MFTGPVFTCRLPGNDLESSHGDAPGVCLCGGDSAVKIKVVLERGEDGYFVAHCPSLKSCCSQGKTRDEAISNIREAIALYLEPESEEIQEIVGREVVELAL